MSKSEKAVPHQHIDASTHERISFTAEELEYLRTDAAAVRAWLSEHGLHPRRVYEEDRLEFVTEYMRGAEPATREKQQKWLKQIKKEVRRLELGVRCERSKPNNP